MVTNASLPVSAIERMAFLKAGTIRTSEELSRCENYIQTTGMAVAFEVQKRVNPIVESMNYTSLALDYKSWISEGILPWASKRKIILDEIQKYLHMGMYSVQDDKQIAEKARLRGIMVDSLGTQWLVNHRHDDPVIEFLLEKRNVDQFLKRFVTDLPGPDSSGVSLLTGKWDAYSSFSGRIAASHLAMTGLPRAMRNYYVAPNIDGKKAVYVSFDESQIELRLLAGYANCTKLLAQLLSGEDIHRYFASRLFGVPEDTVSEQMRRLSKKIIYGTVYGAGSKRLHEISAKSGFKVVISPGELLKQLYPEMLSALRRFRQSDVIWYGLQPTKFSPRIGDTEIPLPTKQNLSIQSASSMLLKQALVRLPDDIRIVNIIYDEIICWCKADEVPSVSRQIRKAYELAATDLHYQIPLTKLIKTQILGGN
ncbi:DNA polymerase [Levilactobacillus suantsaiihabitans]|uniref:DNA-directed DNA polymerase n=1 Tax=Levilactobacillus suantsaiihabitans TaxID=2487722 RepID=A0A4Z0J580_9LACO|nr:DNA polymerase [Levilactobacillus suantsaiihabitans]TGD17560.1 hypothetical protein EGT51_11885 [Levilactobacillus suantsaiihabitans]